MKKQNNHGGKRPGSGRKTILPALRKQPVSYRLPGWLITWLRAQERPSSQLIEEALCKQFKLKPVKKMSIELNKP